MILCLLNTNIQFLKKRLLITVMGENIYCCKRERLIQSVALPWAESAGNGVLLVCGHPSIDFARNVYLDYLYNGYRALIIFNSTVSNCN